MNEEVIVDLAAKNTGKVFEEFKKNQTIVYLFVFSILFFIALYTIVTDKNKQITELKATLEVYQKRNDVKDSIIRDQDKTIGGFKILQEFQNQKDNK